MAGMNASNGGREVFLSSPVAGWDHIPSLALGNHHATPIASEFRASKHVTLMDRMVLITEQSTSSSHAAPQPTMTPYAMTRAWVRNDVELDPPPLPSTREPHYTTAALPPPPPSPAPAPSALGQNGGPIDFPEGLPPEDLFSLNKKHWVAVRAYHSEIDQARQARHAASAKLQ